MFGKILISSLMAALVVFDVGIASAQEVSVKCVKAQKNLLQAQKSLAKAQAAVKRYAKKGGKLLSAAKAKRIAAKANLKKATKKQSASCNDNTSSNPGGNSQTLTEEQRIAQFKSIFHPISEASLEGGLWSKTLSNTNWRLAMQQLGIFPMGWYYFDDSDLYQNIEVLMRGDAILTVQFSKVGSLCALNFEMERTHFGMDESKRLSINMQCNLRDGNSLDYTVLQSLIDGQFEEFNYLFNFHSLGDVGSTGTLLVGEGSDSTLAIYKWAVALSKH